MTTKCIYFYQTTRDLPDKYPCLGLISLMANKTNIFKNSFLSNSIRGVLRALKSMFPSILLPEVAGPQVSFFRFDLADQKLPGDDHKSKDSHIS